MVLKCYRLCAMGQLNSNLQSPTAGLAWLQLEKYPPDASIA
jgi:hypothetical protein